MPRIDPFTGVPVMTMGEFWQKQAEHEGRDAFELMDEFVQSLEDENQRERDRLFSHAGALETLQYAIEGENNWRQQEREYYLKHPQYQHDPKDFEEIPPILHIIEVEDAEYRGNLREQVTKLVAIVEFEKLGLRKVTLSRTYISQTYIDPPEDEQEFAIEEI